MNQGLGPSTLLFTYIPDDTVRYGPTSADTVTVSLVPLHFWIPRFNTHAYGCTGPTGITGVMSIFVIVFVFMLEKSEKRRENKSTNMSTM